ncbi:DUF2842 domain-containing protein [Parasphingorhabdus sp. DH2-15]|uniref:DUF2842 domain-containing protein n=1 Tax=Parasphingorhabdus sp. DH2-15 TaxID=3444112 RepID=UPI003F682241
MKPTMRKPAGMIAILLIITIWSVIIINIADYILTLPVIVQAIFFLIAGIIWIFPVRPILVWMELGRWKI